MKKLSTIYLLGALVTLGSCAREYPVFNQMPKNAYIGQPDRSEVNVKAQAPAEVAAVCLLAKLPLNRIKLLRYRKRFQKDGYPRC